MRCRKCGAELPDGARFCYMCATPVEVEPEESVAEVDGEGMTEETVAEDDAEKGESPAAEPDESVEDPVGNAEPEQPPAEDGQTEDVLEAEPEPESDELADNAEKPVEDEAPSAEASAPVDETAEAEPDVIPAVHKLETPLPVGAVPFVPMAPSPRSTYVQRRAPRPVRPSARPGVNSAPTVASGYTNLGWNQGASWPQEKAEGPVAGQEPSPAASQGTFDGFKNKFNQALESWVGASASREQRKREARAAAERVEAAGREQREREERARQEELDRETLERQARAEEAALAERVREEAARSAAHAAEQAAAAARAEAEAAARDAAIAAQVTASARADAAQEAAEAERTMWGVPVRAPQTPAAAEPMTAASSEPDTAAADGRTAQAPALDANEQQVNDTASRPADDFESESTRDLGPAYAAYQSAGHAPRARRSSRRASIPKPALLGGIAAAFVVVCVAVGMGIFAPHEETPQPTLKPAEGIAPITDDSQQQEEPATDDSAPAVRSSVNDYSWDELSQISALISQASSDSDALTVAKKYNLCSSSGKLDGTQAKSVQLSDGTTVKMRVAGFRQDTLADGSGKAGISFICDSAVAVRALNAAGAVDWSTSDLCAWLSSDGEALLPSELTQKIVSVNKLANRVNEAGSQETVAEKLWIPSYSEVVGNLTSGSVRYGSYTPEGVQYQLFSDQGGAWDVPSEIFKVSGECSNWWTRSADPTNSGLFIAPRNSDGGPGYARNAAISSEVGVVPGFCL